MTLELASLHKVKTRTILPTDEEPFTGVSRLALPVQSQK